MAEGNENARLEAFCDGVFAIALTLLIIDIKVPAAEHIASTADFWRALQHLAPSVFAFVLSFAIILITWVNHHATLKFVHRSSGAFNYANGFLLLTIVFIPFPTSLLGEYLFTDHAAPAVVLYNAVIAFQSIGWFLMSRTAIAGGLASGERPIAALRENERKSLYALGFYGVLAVAAMWIPFGVAILTTASWTFWLVMGIRMKRGRD